jgi:hypothetical protein
MIREQKQCSSSPAWRASRQYKIYSHNAVARGDEVIVKVGGDAEVRQTARCRRPIG